MKIQDSVPCEVIYLLKLVIIISATANRIKFLSLKEEQEGA
jgi:hypothetical protein